MFGSFTRSWQITKLTFKIMNKDKRLFLFPIFSAIFSTLFVISMILPSIILPGITTNSVGSAGISLLLIFGLYFGLAFIATFFNVGVVYIIKNILEEKKPTFKESIKFAFSKIGLIIGWSLISATVGLIFRILDEIAERVGGIGEIFIKILTSMIGGLWSFITIFVIPVMVYENTGPFKAISKSATTFKKTWGESVIKTAGLGVVQILFIILGVAATIFGLILFVPLGGIATMIFVVLMAIYFVFILCFFSVANNIYNTALYVYAQTGNIPLGYDDSIAHSFEKKKE